MTPEKIPELLSKVEDALCCAEGSILKKRLDHLEDKMDIIDGKVTNLIISTADLITAHNATIGAITFVVAIGKVIGFLAKVAMALAALFVIYRSIATGNPTLLQHMMPDIFNRSQE